jgi:hypothetical protein
VKNKDADGKKFFSNKNDNESEDDEVNEDDVANEKDSIKIHINFNDCIDNEEKQERINKSNLRT